MYMSYEVHACMHTLACVPRVVCDTRLPQRRQLSVLLGERVVKVLDRPRLSRLRRAVQHVRRLARVADQRHLLEPSLRVGDEPPLDARRGLHVVVGGGKGLRRTRRGGRPSQRGGSVQSAGEEVRCSIGGFTSSESSFSQWSRVMPVSTLGLGAPTTACVQVMHASAVFLL